ncbi:MAG: hypothetical protein ACRCW1_00595 [Anaerotignaceae bacterium]
MTLQELIKNREIREQQDKNDIKALAFILLQTRIENNITLDMLELKSGISKRTMCDFFNNAHRKINIKTITAIHDALIQLIDQKKGL